MRLILNATTKMLGLALMLAAMSSLSLADGLPGHGPVATPEIDPSSLAAAATLLSGGVLWITGRRRSK